MNYLEYVKATGVPTGRSYVGLVGGCPPDSPTHAWVFTDVEVSRAAVDLSTDPPTVYKGLPRKPSDTEYIAWVWDAIEGAWVNTRTEKAYTDGNRIRRAKLLEVSDVLRGKALELIAQGYPSETLTPIDAYKRYLRDLPTSSATWGSADEVFASPPSVLPDASTLEGAKALRWIEAKAARAQAEVAPINVNGNVFDADPASVQKIMGAVILASALGSAYSVEWTLADNTRATLDGPGVTAVGVALGMRSAAIHEEARRVRAEIEGAETLEAVAEVAWAYPV